MPEPDCSSSSSELPLPPPPSPTQLLQYEAEELLLVPQNQNQQQQHPTQGSAPANPHPNPDPQQQQQQQASSKHTRSLSSISSGSSQTSSSGVGGCAQLSPSLVASSASTLSLDMEHSPQHSRQASGSCTSLDVASVVQCPVDNYTMSMPSPPPPPAPAPAPPRPTQNENDMNTQNKSHNAYNQMLKQYANKLQQQHPNNSNNNTNTTATETTTNRHNNTAKPFATTTTTTSAATGQLQPHVAALTATLANQLKFNSHQATAATATAATAAAANSYPAQSEIMSAHVADEQSSANYSYNNNNNMGDSAACTGPCMQTSASGSDQPFEYVTLTGNVIRSVQPPGKGPGASYRVSYRPPLPPARSLPLSQPLANTNCFMFFVNST
ncbi:PDZ and LIM domain protein Zasp-like [Drosophila montana]|uniref:PDZ and LIM domain protein Zasp-like n=1 Tax=Drosophila montana TaxID=40370 RepID=UPI00313DE5D3